MKEKKVGNDQALCSAMHLLLIFAVFPSTMEPASFAMLKQKRKKKNKKEKTSILGVPFETHKHSAKGKLSKATFV